MATGAGSAWALSDLTQHYYGLLVKSSSGVTLGEIDTTTTTNNLNQRLVTDSQGDRQQPDICSGARTLGVDYD